MSQSVQCFGRKRNATAVAHCKTGRGVIKVNGRPIDLVEPKGLKLKVYEPILILGQDRFSPVDIRVRVKGGGQSAQIYAIRQAIAKSLVAYYQKYIDESSKNEIKEILSTMNLELGMTQDLGDQIKKLLQTRRPDKELLRDAYNRLGSDLFIYTKNRNAILMELGAILRD